MICSACGGHVTWRGPMSNLTHTECAGCGRHNSQLPEGQGYYDPEGCVECDWGEQPCHCTGTPWGEDFLEGARAVPSTCIETIGGDPATALRLSFQIKVF